MYYHLYQNLDCLRYLYESALPQEPPLFSLAVRTILNIQQFTILRFTHNIGIATNK